MEVQYIPILVDSQMWKQKGSGSNLTLKEMLIQNYSMYLLSFPQQVFLKDTHFNMQTI